MKKAGLLAILFLLMAGQCRKRSYDNPYLHPGSFRIALDLRLPAYSSLQYPGNAIYVNQGGILGVFIYNNGNNYLAFEAADPNHKPEECDAMTLDGTQARCRCDGNVYTLTDGHLVSGSGDYPMLPYNTSLDGNILYIYH